tara:strand:- start:2966 stop:3265 length:300 start_codon:yes stop_codon:yes gene_type:complete
MEATKMKRHTINQNGRAQIAQQLKEKTKPSVFDGWLDDDLIDSQRSQEMLSAWADELETKLDEGEGDEVEISKHDTKSGRTEFLYVDEHGYDIEEEVAK